MFRKLIIFICTLFTALSMLAQTGPDLPQRTLTVRSTQALNFGDMTIVNGSSGGTVTVDANGARSATGSVLLLQLGNPVQPSIFEVNICPGRMVNLTYPSTITLTGNNGGTMLLHIGPTNIGGSGSTFISNKGCDDTHLIRVGGVLDVGSMASNPAGVYSGVFNLTFVQQ